MSLESILSHEVLYRKCSHKEAEATIQNEGLIFELVKIIRENGFVYGSEPYKWLSRDPKFIKKYKPKGSFPEEFNTILEFKIAEGTTSALELEKLEGKIQKGPKGSYGLPNHLIPWFNRRIISIKSIPSHEFVIPKNKKRENIHNYLTVPNNKYALFIAVNPKLINENKFTDQLNFKRMTWLKSSLLWTIAKSNWGLNPNQQCILEIDIDTEYLHNLYSKARWTKSAPMKHPVLIQKDPDKRIIGRRFQNNINTKHNYEFANGGKTTHFGIRTPELETFVNQISYQNLKNITPQIRQIHESRPEHPTSELYKILDLKITLYDISIHTHLLNS